MTSEPTVHTPPTRLARATITRIGGDMIETTACGDRDATYVLGSGFIVATIGAGADATEWRWRVSDPTAYRVGDVVEVTVPA